MAALILGVPGVSVAQTDTAGDSARHHYRAGLRVQTQRDLDAARRAYEEAVRRTPLAVALDRLGFVLWSAGSTGAAIAEFEKAAKADPALFEAFYHLGATLWWTGEAERALESLRTAVRLQPDHAEARYYLGLCAQETRRAAPCHRAARRIGTAERIDSGVGAATRPGASGRGDAGGAIDQLRRAVALDPSSREARNALGLALLQHGDGDAAVETFRALVAADPTFHSARLNLGHDADAAGRSRRRCRRAARADRAGSRQCGGALQLGVALKQRDDFTGAEVALRRATELSQRSRTRRSHSASCCGRLAGPPRRSTAFREAIARRRRTTRRTTCSARCLRQLGDHDGAISEFREAIRLQPASAEAHLSLGQLLQQRGDACRRRGRLHRSEPAESEESRRPGFDVRRRRRAARR